jgi:tetratricopeptide (TPR) repeat protein
VLEQQLQLNPESRAALSLLGYCYYYLGMFPEAASMYEQLIRLHPDVDDYKVHYSKSLYKVTRFPFRSSFAISLFSFPFLDDRMMRYSRSLYKVKCLFLVSVFFLPLSYFHS